MDVNEGIFRIPTMSHDNKGRTFSKQPLKKVSQMFLYRTFYNGSVM